MKRKKFVLNKKTISTPLILLIGIFLILIPVIFLINRNHIKASASLLKFDEGYGTITKDVQNIGTGNIAGATWAAEDLCLSGKCLYFNGTSAYVDLGDNSNYDFTGTDNFTINLWFRHIPMTSGTQVLIAKQNNSAGYKIQMESDGDLTFALDDDGTSFPEESITTTEATYDDNMWHQLAAVKTGQTKMDLYIDGVLRGTHNIATATGSLANNYSLFIGVNGDGVTNYYQGFIDEVNIYKSTTADTATSIKALTIRDTGTDGSSVSFGNNKSYLSDGLVGYWKMDETSWTKDAANSVLDASGNGGHGVPKCNGTCTISGITRGKFGNSGNFDGVDDFVRFPNSAVYAFPADTNFTVSVWVKTTQAATSNQWPQIVSKEGGGQGYSIVLHDSNSDSRWYGTINDGGGEIKVWGRSNVADGLWHHLVLQRSGSQLYTFEDGVLANSILGTNGSLDGGINLRLGMWNDEVDYPYAGQIDEARIYNRALSTAEVQQLYNWAAGPVGWWKLDGFSGSNATQDSSGYNNTTTTHLLTNDDWIQGKIGNAARLSGNAGSESITAIDTPALSITGDFTIGTWFNPYKTTTATRYPIVAKYEGTNISYEMSLFGDELRLKVGSTANYVTTNSANLIIGNWYYVNATYNSAAQTVKIYINGTEQATTTTGTIPSSIPDLANILSIGAAPGSGASVSAPVQASLDDMHCGSIASDSERNVTACGPGLVTNTTVMAGNANPGDEYSGGFRFAGVNVPQGANIVSATFTITGGISYDASAFGHVVKYLVSGQASDNAVGFTGSTNQLSVGTRPRTTAYSGPWDQTTVVQNTAYSISIKDIVQEIVNRSGWNSGNAMVIIMDTTADTDIPETQDYYSWDNAANRSKVAKIDITYGGAEYFDGAIDDVKIYNYIRSPSQMIEDMNGGHPAPGSPIGSPVTWYKFDEGYGDYAYNSGSGGHQQDGNLYGNCPGDAICPLWTNSGKFGKALVFNGIENSVTTSTTYNSVYDIQNYTISAWIYRTGNPDASNGGGIAGRWSTSEGTFLWLDPSNNISFPVGASPHLSAGVTAPLNNWVYVAGTFDGATSVIYVNGKRMASQADSVGYASMSSRPFEVGSYAQNPPVTTFPGRIDEVKYYTSTLSDEQIKEDYNQGKATALSSTSTDSSGVAINSSSGEYCIPGDTTSCASPMGEWNLDENSGQILNDTTGNNLTGTLGIDNSESTNDPKWNTGKFGSSLKFDGINDYTRILDNDLLTPANDMTMSMWFKLDVLPSVAGQSFYLFDKQNSTSPYHSYYCIVGTDDRVTCYWFSSTNVEYGNQYTSLTLQPNTWYYLVFKRESGLSKVYINGMPDAADVAVSGTLKNSDAKLDFGANTPNGSNWFKGTIDNVKLYNYARTSAQIMWEYNKGVPVAWYKFDECQNSTAFNSALNSNGFPAGMNGVLNPVASDQTTVGDCSTNANSMWYNGRNGKYNSALNFDGIDDSVIIDDVSKMNLPTTGNGSFSFWARRIADTSDEQVALSFLVSGTTDDTYMNIMPFNPSQCAGNISLSETWSPNTWMYNCMTTSLPLNTWGHFVFVVDTTDEYLYYNGKRIWSGGGRVYTPAAPTKMMIGNRFYTNASFDGQIDDVRIYNYALTQGQINTIFNAGNAVNFTH